MPVVPDQILERLQWFEQRVPNWKLAPGPIGLTPAQANALDLAVKAARTAYDAAHAARITAKNATVGQTSAMRTMSNLGSDTILFIRAFANTQANPDTVYQTASIPPPQPATPAGDPKPPTNVIGDPNADGTVTLKWEGSTANQTFFTVWRKVGNINNWTQVGAVATKKFVDESVPAGTPYVTYVVKAQRNSVSSGDSDQTVVNFGMAA